MSWASSILTTCDKIKRTFGLQKDQVYDYLKLNDIKYQLWKLIIIFGSGSHSIELLKEKGQFISCSPQGKIPFSLAVNR